MLFVAYVKQSCQTMQRPRLHQFNHCQMLPSLTTKCTTTTATNTTTTTTTTTTSRPSVTVYSTQKKIIYLPRRRSYRTNRTRRCQVCGGNKQKKHNRQMSANEGRLLQHKETKKRICKLFFS